MNIQTIKNKLSILKHTPLHPQWLIFRNDKERMKQICGQLKGIVFDIGCASMTPKKYLPDGCDYFGLDYPDTADNWYLTKPNIYGDAQKLPLKQNSIDNILLLDVLEHLPSPGKCISEIFNALKPEGKLIIRVPFMYPIHDAPLDFHRWTINGLNQLAINNNFLVIDTQQSGSPIETAAMLANIALTKTLLDSISQKKILSVFMISFIIIIPIINLFGWLFSFLGHQSAFMPSGYTMTLQKNNS